MSELDHALMKALGVELPADGGDYFATRTLPDGRWAAVYPLTEGRARLGVGASEADGFFDDLW